MGDVGVRITLVKQRDSNSTGTPSQILKSTLKESGRFCYHLFSAEQRKPQDHLELATLCFVDSCFRNVLYHSLSIQIALYPTIPIEQTLHLVRCRLRHLDIIQLVLKSPTTAIGFGYRHTSERIHQWYYIRPTNLVLSNKKDYS